MLAAIFLARNLQPQGFAAYGYFQMTVAMLTTYAAMGLGVTASRYFAEFERDRGGDSAPIGTLLALSLFLAATAFMIVLLLPGAWLHAGLPVPQWLIALGVAIAVAGVVPGGGILGLEKYRQASIVSLLSAIVMLGMAWLAARSKSPILAMWGIVGGAGVQLVGQLVVIVFTTGWQAVSDSCRWTRREIRKLAGFAGPMFLVSILAGSGTWIVGRLILADSGERNFAAYSIGLQWFALGLLLPGMVSRVLLPSLVRSRGGDAKGLVRTGIAMAMAPALAMVLAGLVLAPSLIRLYGNEYSEFSFVIPVFLWIALMSAPVNTVGNAIVAKNGQIAWLCFSAISFVALLLTLIFAPHATVAWASTAHFIATSLMLAMTGLHGNRKGLI